MLNGEATPLLMAQNVTVTYPGRVTQGLRRPPRTVALDQVSIEINRGESLAIVGESGSGKSTLVKALLGLERVDSGEIRFDGRRVTAKGRELWLRRRTGVVFQDPYSSFNPRLTIGESVGEPLDALGVREERQQRILTILSTLGLPEDTADRYPSEFSGGQRQRIAIARALIHHPELLVGDEPVSALDVLVRTSIIEELRALRQEMGLTMILVTHDLSIVPEIADRVLVLQDGRLVETGTIDEIFGDPQEAYTQSLIQAIPRLPKLREDR